MEYNSTDQSIFEQDKQSINQEIDDKLLIIWSNGSDNNETDDIKETCQYLNTTKNKFRFFNNTDECLDYITSIDENIHTFLIISSPTIDISIFHEFSQIKRIYIYNTNAIEDDKNKQNIFNNKNLLIKKLEQDIVNFSKYRSIPMTFYNDKNSSKQNQYFLYMHLFMEILLRDKDSIEAKHDLIQVCEEYYSNDQYQLIDISKFKEENIRNKAIQWFTRDSFLSRLLNKALRNQEFDIIYKFRYIINELVIQLKNLNLKQRVELNQIQNVYHGQLIHKNQLEIFRENQGGLVSMNSFLSTTLDKDEVLCYILGANPGASVPILFEINTESISTSCANIQNYSIMSDQVEILFSIDCIFRIDTVEEYSENDQIYYLIKLTVTEEYEELEKLTDDIRKTFNNDTIDLSTLGLLMLMMDHFSKARYFYDLRLRHLLPVYSKNDPEYIDKQIQDNENENGTAVIETMCSNMDEVRHSEDRCIKELDYCKKSLTFLRVCGRADSLEFGKICIKIGMIYIKQNNYTKAMRYIEKAIDILSKSSSENESDLEKLYSFAGSIYFHQEKCEEALNCFNKALTIQSKLLPKNHPDIALTYRNIASVHDKQGNSVETLENYEIFLNIELKRLLEDLPDISKTRHVIEEIHPNEDNHNTALKYCKELLKIQLRDSEKFSQDIANTYNKMGFIYKRLGDYVAAIDCYGKTLDIQLKSSSENYSDIARTYWNIGNVYSCSELPQRANEEWKQGLEIASKSLPPNDPMIIGFKRKLGL